MKQMQLSVGDINLLIEALAYRASRLDSMARFSPQNAGPYERKAEAMRVLRAKLVRAPIAGDLAGVQRG